MLNAPQREAVEHTEGPLLIFAGAGSGKTRVLTMRIVELLRRGVAEPSQILALTFTNKSAREMRARVADRLGRPPEGMWIGTFHAVGARMLRRDVERLGYRRGFAIFDEDDQKAIVKRALAELDLDPKRHNASALLARISRAKAELSVPGDRRVAAVSEAYNRIARDSNGMDFDDILVQVVRLLEDHAEIREHWQRHFTQVLVDEYQDTNRAQYRFLSLVAGAHRNLTVVGDDDQSIYAFRGADVRNILEFQRDHPDAKVVKLEQNYRSTQSILDAAHRVIERNPQRASKQLWSDLGRGSRPVLVLAEDDEREADYVVGEIEALARGQGRSFGDFAVLFRTNTQSRSFERALTAARVPYNLVGGLRFWDRREVKDVVAYLRFLANPLDAVSFDRIANVPKRRISERTVQAAIGAAADGGMSLLDVCGMPAATDLKPDAREALLGFHRDVAPLAAEAATLKPSELVQLLYRRVGLAAIYDDGTRAGGLRLDNLEEIRRLATEYDRLTAPRGLERFLTDLALMGDSDDLDERRRRVTLITLHMAKGLEWPVVYLTGLEDKVLPHERAFAEKGGLEEERRLCYVGMTRAQELLYLTAVNVRHLFGKAVNLSPSQFLGDLSPELLELVELDGHWSGTVAARFRRGMAG
jgi:DNA helicase II / ATP-dependent DNA helicase PcrA